MSPFTHRLNSLIKLYVSANSDQEIKEWSYNRLKTTLKNKFQEHPKLADMDRNLFPDYLDHLNIIKNVYLTENEALIHLFSNYFPTPPATLFDSEQIPAPIREKEKKRQAFLSSIHSKNLSEKQLNARIITFQRLFRKHLRQQKERKRVKWIHEHFLLKNNMSAKDFLKDANKPYTPQCNRKLAQKIVDAAKQVELFSTARHITSQAALKNILDDALYGRKNLQQLYIEFQPASLDGCDIRNGDGNAICFAPNEIDPRAIKKNSVELLFDIQQLLRTNPPLFYKQRDLAYEKNKKHAFSLSEELHFSNSSCSSFVKFGCTPMTFFYKNQKIESHVPCGSLIAYDEKNMHSILSLNFFRFLDKLNEKPDTKALVTQVYKLIEELEDNQLIAFLSQLGKQMTETAEINFYAALKVDFSSLITIRTGIDLNDSKQSYTLHLKSLIDRLNKGELAAITEMKQHLPELVESQRFVHYLLTKVTHQSSLQALQNLNEPSTLESTVFHHQA